MPATITEVLDQFYTAFQNGDAETMAALYHPEARFSDPAFPDLSGDEAGDMWRMLTSRSQGNLSIDYHIELVEVPLGVVHWEAKYPFGPKQRPVHNKIKAYITVEDGRITKHRDQFNFWRWARQALGGLGFWLGWTPFLRKKVQQQAARSLASFRAKAQA